MSLFKIEIEVNHNIRSGSDTALADVKHELQCLLKLVMESRVQIMSAISDFSVKQKAYNAEVKSDLDTIKTSIDTMNALIAVLQNSAGQITPADQATLDSLDMEGKALADQADTTAGKTPPTPPSA